MKKIIVFIIIYMLEACSVYTQQNTITGTFIGKTPRYSSFVPSGTMSIHFKSNGKFDLTWLDIDYSGRWEIIKKDQVVLKFDKISDYILLCAGTLSGEDKIVYLINKNKIKVNGNVLKRIY